MDFILKPYEKLLETLMNQGFSFSRFEDFISNSVRRVIVLRNDVDALPQNSLQFARIQANKGIKGTYYFRMNPKSYNENIIKEIASLGHEVGYHYEDVSLTARRLKAKGSVRQKDGNNGNMKERYKGQTETAVSSRKYDKAEYERYLMGISIESFQENLEKLRKIVPVRTICMHGSPMSNWDSRLLWKYYDYKDFGIIGEPYFDVNFNKVLYLTDTGRRWDGDAVSMRDKVGGIGLKAEGIDSRVRYPPLSLSSSFCFNSTFDIIKAAEKGRLPDKIMMTFHPQRWTDKPVPWMRELIWQNVKNAAKYFLIRMKH
jgi:hypothetical protein